MATVTLTDFLLARIAEDASIARAAMPAPWTSEESGQDAILKAADGYPLSECGDGHSGWADMADARHIRRHDPARVLAECEAKRRIVEQAWVEYVAAVREFGGPPFDREGMVAEGQSPAIVRLLALPYADHPDYDESWRP